ncbi:MAG: hypothetical protein FWG19_01710 [Methanomassiliicoccaceae archaeon]|nr:hypothetical protein [Methanomassiliicoccaceae archaeon]
MGLKEVLERLDSDGSVKAAFLLEGEPYDRFVAEEGGVTGSFSGMPFVNRAFKEVIKRKIAVCIFARGPFEPDSDHILIMEDSNGNVVGHDVPECMMDRYKNDPEIFWLSDDFAVYPDRAGMHDVVMVMLPKKVTSIGEKEGIKDPIMLYPATTTDMILKRHFNMLSCEPGLATAILAFDVI